MWQDAHLHVCGDVRKHGGKKMPIHKLHQSKLWKYPDGMHGDGNNLYLQVRGDARSFMYRSNRYQEGLGSLRFVDLPEARAKAVAIRKLEHEGRDPKAERNGAKLDRTIQAARVKTVNQVVDEYWAMKIAHCSASRIKHTRYMLQKHVRAKIGEMPIQKVDTNTILDDAGVGLSKLWMTKGTHTSAWHLQIHLERIFRLAIAKLYFDGKNPAQWKDHLEQILPASGDVHERKRQPSLPYQDLPRFMAMLHDHQDRCRKDSVAPFVLEWIARTGARENEVCRMPWVEIDRPNKLWNMSWERRKNRRHVPKGEKHSRPLTPRLEWILDEMERRRVDHSPNAPVFGRLYANNTISQTLHWIWKDPVANPDGSMSQITVHGFRRTYNTWAGANRFTQREIDGQLDHKVPGQTRQAYDPGATAEERRSMMMAYDNFIDRPTPAAGTNVTEFKRRRSA
jgi:integrase